jgi:hypothetical protein
MPVAPTHNLPILNRDNRDEAVFVELAGADCIALNFILEDDDTGSLGMFTTSASAPCNAIPSP